ncbi:MAG: hypothetical protein AAB391_02655 [Patescibacteria group bacterium]
MYLNIRGIENDLYPEIPYYRFVWGPVIEKMLDFKDEKTPFRLRMASTHYRGASENIPDDTDIKVLVFAVRVLIGTPDHFCFGAHVISGWPPYEGRVIEGGIMDDGSGLFVLTTPDIYLLAGFDRTINRAVYTA